MSAQVPPADGHVPSSTRFPVSVYVARIPGSPASTICAWNTQTHVNEPHHLSRFEAPDPPDLTRPTQKRNTRPSFAVVMLQMEMVLFVCMVLLLCVFSQEPSSKVVADRYAVFWNRTNTK